MMYGCDHGKMRYGLFCNCHPVQDVAPAKLEEHVNSVVAGMQFCM